MSRSGGLLARLPGARGSSAAPNTLELHIDCDDIQAIWDRFPALVPEVTPESLPRGLLIVREQHLKGMAPALALPAELIAESLREPLNALAAAWSTRDESAGWDAVADVLVGGIGLGVAIPRQLSWRAPAAFAREVGQGGDGARPFLQLCFLPGSGAAGLAVLDATAAAPVDRVVTRAAGNDWAQTWRSYDSSDGELTAYGQAGQALLAAGILRRRGVSLQARSILGSPLLTRAALVAVQEPWRALIAAGAMAVNAHRAVLLSAIETVWPEAAPAMANGDGVGSSNRVPVADANPAPLACDYLDACYFALADLVFTRIAKDTQATGRPHARPAKISAVVIEEPGLVWRWLTAG